MSHITGARQTPYLAHESTTETSAGCARAPSDVRRRRQAASRLAPLADGRCDPLDRPLDAPVSVIVYEVLDAADLGLLCDHDDRCPAKEVAV